MVARGTQSSKMISLLLSILLVNGICATPDTTPGCPTTTGLNFYVATTMSEPWLFVGSSVVTEGDGSMCVYYEPPMAIAAEIVYVIATAYNSAGESTTEHGTFYGEGYIPEAPCP